MLQGKPLQVTVRVFIKIMKKKPKAATAATFFSI